MNYSRGYGSGPAGEGLWWRCFNDCNKGVFAGWAAVGGVEGGGLGVLPLHLRNLRSCHRLFARRCKSICKSIPSSLSYRGCGDSGGCCARACRTTWLAGNTSDRAQSSSSLAGRNQLRCGAYNRHDLLASLVVEVGGLSQSMGLKELRPVVLC